MSQKLHGESADQRWRDDLERWIKAHQSDDDIARLFVPPVLPEKK